MDAPRILSIVLAGLLSLLAVDADAGSSRAGTRAPIAILIPLVVNRVPAGEAFVYRVDDDVLIREVDLASAGIRTERLRGRIVQVDAAAQGEGHVSLSSLAPAVSFVLDVEQAVLRIDARPDLLPAREIDVSSRERPAALQRDQDAAVFVNYSWRGFELVDPSRRNFTVAGEAGASAGGIFAYTAAATDVDGTPVRGLSWVSVDLPGQLARFTAGDSFASSTSLGGGSFVGGLQFARRFELDPWLMRTPLPSLSGAAESPSSLEIYVDDVLVRREQIDPGVFQIENLPVTAGSGNTRYVLRDAFGRETHVSGSYTVGSSLLRAGLSDFSYTAGFRREQLGIESMAYGDPIVLGAHRFGVTDWMTGGLRLEAAADLVSGGGAVAVGTPIGLVSLEGAASGMHGAMGTAGSLTWAYASRAIGLSLWAQAQSERYAHISLAPEADRALLDTGAGVSVPLGAIGSASLRSSHRRMRDADVENTQAIGATWRLAPGLSLSTTGARTDGGAGSSWEAFAALAIVLPRSATAQVWANANGDSTLRGFAVQESSLDETGWDYRAALTQGDAETTELRAGYRGSLGQARAGIVSMDGHTSVGTEVAGSIVAIGDRVFLSRPIDRSFALVRVPGVPDASVRLNNREVGRTDSKGDLFVPGLLSYDANRISVDPTDVPFDRSFRSLDLVVAPPRGGGIVAEIEVDEVRAVRGRVVRYVSGGQTAPIGYGEMVVRTTYGPKTFPLGSLGQFELDLPSGAYSARVRDGRGACAVEFVIPEFRTGFQHIGTVICLEELDT